MIVTRFSRDFGRLSEKFETYCGSYMFLEKKCSTDGRVMFTV